MNKSELIDAMAAVAGLTKVDSKKALDAFIQVAGETLKVGDKLTLVGFGTLSVAEKAARQGRNPQSGAKIKIPAKKVIKFKAGADLNAKIQ